VAKSNQVVGWAGNGWHAHTRWWIEAVECYWRWARSGVRDRILLVYYEDLVLETETTLREICRFIGEEFEPQMLSWERIVDREVAVRERNFQTKLKLKIGAEGITRWKREMSARQTFICEAFMGSNLRRLGYELRHAGRLWVPIFALTRVGYRTVYPVYELATRIRRGLRNRFFK
jgi:hypothetical protein